MNLNQNENVILIDGENEIHFINEYYGRWNFEWKFSNITKHNKVTNPFAQVNLIDDDYRIVFELSMFAINIMREIYGIIKSFLFVKKKMKKKNLTTYYVWF